MVKMKATGAEIDEKVLQMKRQREITNKIIEEYTLEINENKWFVLYLASLISKYQAITIMLENNGLYDAIFVIARSFLENYTIAKNLIEKYKTMKYNDYLKELVINDLRQDYTMNSYLEKEPPTYITKRNYMVSRFLPEFFDENKGTCKGEFKKKIFKIKTKSISKEIESALNTNSEFKKQQDVPPGYVYPLLCSISHVNFDYIGSSVDEENKIRINSFTRNIPPVVDTIILCYSDIGNLIENKFYKKD